MNPRDPLETELRAMRPRAATAELKRGIVDRLERPMPPPPAQRSWGVALAGALAAACLAAIVLWRGDPLRSRREVAGPPAAPVVELGDLGTSVLAYRHALVRSTEDFSALLDQHAAVTLPHDQARNGIRAFVRLNSDQSSWTGEL